MTFRSPCTRAKCWALRPRGRGAHRDGAGAVRTPTAGLKRRHRSGKTHAHPHSVAGHSPRHGPGARRRKRHGLVLSMARGTTPSLPILSRLARLGWILRAKEQAIVEKFFAAMRVRTRSMDTVVAALRAATSRKWSWPSGSPPSAAFYCSTSRHAASTWARKPKFTRSSTSSPATAPASSSSQANSPKSSTSPTHPRAAPRPHRGRTAREKADQDTIMRLMAGIG